MGQCSQANNPPILGKSYWRSSSSGSSTPRCHRPAAIAPKQPCVIECQPGNGSAPLCTVARVRVRWPETQLQRCGQSARSIPCTAVHAPLQTPARCCSTSHQPISRLVKGISLTCASSADTTRLSGATSILLPINHRRLHSGPWLQTRTHNNSKILRRQHGQWPPQEMQAAHVLASLMWC